MAFHTIKVSGVSDELLQLLDERIRDERASGRSEYILELIRGDVFSEESFPRERALRDIVAPIHAATPADETDEESEQFVEELIARVRSERRDRQSPPETRCRDGSPAVNRVVLDCGIFLQAVLRRTASANAWLELGETGAVALVISRAVYAELQQVLQHPEFKSRREGWLTPRRIVEILGWIGTYSTLIMDVPEVVTFDRDPSVEPYLNLAIATGAAYLVTCNKDLLELQEAASQPGTALRLHAPQLAIVDPAQLQRSLRLMLEEC